MDKPIYYVYELVDPLSSTVFYVGKGSKKRCHWHTDTVKKGKSTDNPHKDAVIRQILSAGLIPVVNKLFENLTETEAFELEAKRIAQLGRRTDGSGILTNICLDSRPPTPDPAVQRERAKKFYKQNGLQAWSFKKGQDAWNKGLSKHTTEEKQALQRERLKKWRCEKYGPPKPKTKLSKEEKQKRANERLKRWRARKRLSL